jgi:hypothetical protein
MKLTSRGVGSALAVAAGSMALALLAASPASASPIFCGAGRGLTAESAIWGAMEDAQGSAQSMGFYGACTLTDAPFIAEVKNDPLRGNFFRASVTVTCEA